MKAITRAAAAMGLLAMAVIPFACAAYGAEGGYVIELTNGERLEANDFSIDEGKLHLVYPVGEAYIPLESVRSVSREGIELGLLQTEGNYIAKPAEPELKSDNAVMPRNTPLTGDTGEVRKRWKSGMFKREKLDTGGWESGSPGWGLRGNGNQPSSHEADDLVDMAEFVSDEELERGFDELFPEFSSYTGLDRL